MMHANLSYSKISKIFITHMHSDHCLGLPGLLCSLGHAKMHQVPVPVSFPSFVVAPLWLCLPSHVPGPLWKLVVWTALGQAQSIAAAAGGGCAYRGIPTSNPQSPVIIFTSQVKPLGSRIWCLAWGSG